MIPSLLMAASAAIVFVLGTAHMVLTFRGPKLRPRDASLQEAMSQAIPGITRQTTIWRMWIGFNASHSMGLLLFGLLYGYLALADGEFIFQSTFLQVLGLAVLTGFVVLAKLYWFIVPLTGASLAWLLYAASVGLAWAG